MSDSNDTDDDDIDFSNKTFINVIWNHKEWDYLVEKISIMLPVVLFGIFGNILVIYIISKNRHIRTPTNLLIGNMALADLLSLILHPWVYITYVFFQNYQLGAVGCRGEAAMECSILIASVISMSAITYDRLTAIVLPKETRLSYNAARIIMVITWVIGVLLSVPLIVYRSYKERQWANFLEKFCMEQTVVINVYWYVILTVLVWLPMGVQLICYIAIFIKLHRYEKIILSKMQHHQVGYKKKAAKMMFTVTVTFMFCRLPFTALIIYRHQLLKSNDLKPSNEIQNTVNDTYITLSFVSKYLICLNATLNPLIYGVTNKKFRRAFKTTALSKWLFPPLKDKKPVIVVKQKAIKTDTSLVRSKNIFLIFKRWKKLPPSGTNDNSWTPESN